MTNFERSLPKKDGSESRLKVDVVRHGPSGYEQPVWRDVPTADDLNAVGYHEPGTKSPQELEEGKQAAINLVRESAEKIADSIGSDEEVIIWASPTGRTIETARIIRDVLEERGIAVRAKGQDRSGIKVFEQIGEAKNFAWELLEPLMTGGEAEYQGTKFFIDKSRSNPNNLEYPEYFTSDAMNAIPPEVMEGWPKGYIEELARFESFADINKRVKTALRRLEEATDKNYRVIVVTHDGIVGSVFNAASPDQYEGINPADFISLERSGGTLTVTRANLPEEV